MRTIRCMAIASALLALGWPGGPAARAAKLTVAIPNAGQVTFVGAFQRWDQDGNARKPVNQKQKIESPEVDAAATKGDGGQWVFQDLPPGTYDLVILAGPRVRLEGFNFPPVLAFDPFFPGTATTDDETRQFVIDDIRKSPHYENKVLPLYVGQGKGQLNYPYDVATASNPGSSRIFAAVDFWSGRPNMSFTAVVMTTA